MKILRRVLIVLILVIIAIALLLFGLWENIKPKPTPKNTEIISEEFFSHPFVVEEIGSMNKSKNPDWWVSSGAYFISKDGVGETLQGNLDSSDKWFNVYRESNPRDTESGARPQNIFRLVSRKSFLNGTQEMYALITYYNASSSEYRNESNGVLFFSRYQDADNLYYTGIRVDGMAVIKKKLHGQYSTLGFAQVFTSIGKKFDLQTNPNILPLNTWIGLRSTIKDIGNGQVRITVSVDRYGINTWEQVLNVIDDGITYGPAITSAGYGGIRTDFMDVKFDNYTNHTIVASSSK